MNDVEIKLTLIVNSDENTDVKEEVLDWIIKNLPTVFDEKDFIIENIKYE